MSNMSDFVEKISKLPEEINQDKEFLVMPLNQIDKILTPSRLKIIELLFQQNPITEEKLSSLFRYDTHSDLVVLKHVKLIHSEKIDEESKHNIITLNRKIKVI